MFFYYLASTFPPHALKGQKHLAQGITLGISAISLAPCRGKSLLKKDIKNENKRRQENQHHDGSDVDIYVEMPPKFFLIVRLKAYLEALLGCPVDIIRKHQHLNPFLLKEVEREGIEVIAER